MQKITYSTLAFNTGRFPCSTCADTYSFWFDRSTVSEEPQHDVLYGNVVFVAAFEDTVNNEYSIFFGNAISYS